MSTIRHIRVEAEYLPEAYEKAILAVWDHGTPMKTEYDRIGDPESRDAHVTVAVKNPFAVPRYHLNIPGGPADLQTYIMEVIDGIHDHWMDPASPNKWKYTYHERLFAYPVIEADGRMRRINQIESICRRLAECPHTRRAQAATWRPGYDNEIDDPPCLQRIWCRLVPKACGDGPGAKSYALQMHTCWRSRDLYKAWFFNVVAMTELQAYISNRISELGGFDVSVGEYHDTADSLHIYGSYFGEALPRIEKMRDGNWRARSVDGEKMDIWREIMAEQRAALLAEAEKEGRKL